MKKFEIKAVVGESRQTFTVQEETASGSYLITANQKFIARMFKGPDGNWKTHEVSDLSPADVNTIGEEIELYLKGTE